RLNKSPARKALETPAVRIKNVGGKIETGCWGDSSSPMPWDDANSNTDSTTTEETTSMIAENRSTTRVMAMGASQPPNKTASAPPLLQTSTSNQISNDMVTTKVDSVTSTWLTGRRTNVKAIAAPKMGNNTDNGANVTTDKLLTGDHQLCVHQYEPQVIHVR